MAFPAHEIPPEKNSYPKPWVISKPPIVLVILIIEMADKQNNKLNFPSAAPTHEEITKRAFLLWKELGEPKGKDQEIWKKAESILKVSAQKKSIKF